MSTIHTTRMNPKTSILFRFKLASSRAIAQNKLAFSVEDQKYSVKYDQGQTTIYNNAGVEYAEISDIIVNPIDQALFLTVKYKAAVRQAIYDHEKKFSLH